MEITPISKNQAEWDIFLQWYLNTDLSVDEKQKLTQELVKIKEEYDEKDFANLPISEQEAIVQSCLSSKDYNKLFVLYFYLDKKFFPLNNSLKTLYDTEKDITKSVSQIKYLGYDVEVNPELKKIYKERISQPAIQKSSLNRMLSKIKICLKDQKQFFLEEFRFDQEQNEESFKTIEQCFKLIEQSIKAIKENPKIREETMTTIEETFKFIEQSIKTIQENPEISEEIVKTIGQRVRTVGQKVRTIKENPEISERVKTIKESFKIIEQRVRAIEERDWNKFLNDYLDKDLTAEEKEATLENLENIKIDYEENDFIKFPIENINKTLDEYIFPTQRYTSLLVILYFVQKKVHTLKKCMERIGLSEQMSIDAFSKLSDLWFDVKMDEFLKIWFVNPTKIWNLKKMLDEVKKLEETAFKIDDVLNQKKQQDLKKRLVS